MTDGRKRGRVVTHYRYTDEEGKLLFQVVRTKKPKGFFQRRPDGKGGWINDLKGVRRVLYQLPKVVAAARDGERVYVVEGEKDAQSLSRLKLVATTNSGGPGRWRKEYGEPLRGARVTILPHNDDEGRQHAQKVAQALHGVAAEVRVVKLPDLPEEGDVSDWIAAEEATGKSKEQIRACMEALVGAAPAWDPQEASAEAQDVFSTGSSTGEKPKQSEILIELAEEAGVQLFHTPDRQAFALIPADEHWETWAIRTETFKLWLLQRYYSATGEAPSAQAVKDARNTLAARAIFEGEEHQVYTRVGESDGAIYVDLCNDGWEAIEVVKTGWWVVSNPPVRFRRSPGMCSLPRPVHGGSIDELRPLVNLPDHSSFVLFVSFLVAALRPRGPYPLLALNGEQGSAKSTLGRIARALVDPSVAPLRTLPTSEQDLMISASQSWLLSFDNLSGLKNWQSDAFCRLATGGGLSTRQLYRDAEEVIFSAVRPVVLNGIEEILGRQDLIDRSVILTLRRILEEDRRPEGKLWPQFEERSPRILGALLDAVSCGLRRESSVRLEYTPRMADFATWIVAAEEALPWPEGTFLDAYHANRADAVAVTLEDDPVAGALREYLDLIPETEETATELYEILPEFAEDGRSRSPDWPKSPRALSQRLRRLAPSLRCIGIDVEFRRTPNQRLIRLAKITPAKDRHHRHLRHEAQEQGGSDDGKDSTVTKRDARATGAPGLQSLLDDVHDENDKKIPGDFQEPAPDGEELRI